MKKARWISAAIGTAVLAAGFVLPASAAFAQSGPNGDAGVLSLLSGNNVNAPISAPVNICGVTGAVGGFANSGCKGGAVSNTIIAGSGGSGGNGNAGVISALSGNTVNAPISAPVNVCGIAAAVVGFANAACIGGAASNTVIAGSNSGGNGNAGTLALLSGNNVNAPVSVPVNVCGIAAGIVGFANAECVGGSFSNTIIPPNTPPSTPPSMPPSMQPTPCQTTPPPPCQCTTAPPTTPPTTGTWSSTPPGGSVPTGGAPTGGAPTGGAPTGGAPTGGAPTGGGVTTSTLPSSLPITGADLAGLAAVALGSLGIGVTSLVVARRRRRNEAA